MDERFDRDLVEIVYACENERVCMTVDFMDVFLKVDVHNGARRTTLKGNTVS